MNKYGIVVLKLQYIRFIMRIAITHIIIQYYEVRIMKKVIGNKNLVITLILIVAIFVCPSCNKDLYGDEIIAISRFMRYFDDPEALYIITLDRYEIPDSESIIYYVDWKYKETDTESFDLLLLYTPAGQSIKMAHFKDMEHGLKRDVKAMWDMVKDEGPTVSFSADEILYIKEQALALRNRTK